MEWPSDILEHVWDAFRVDIRKGLKKRLWSEVHEELLSRMNPIEEDFSHEEAMQLFMEGLDEPRRAMYEPIRNCQVCCRIYGWGEPDDCSEHYDSPFWDWYFG